jgi:ubiquitin-protein ligase
MNFSKVIRYRSRILREYNKLYKNENTDCYYFESQQGRQILFSLKGASDSIYENKKFYLQVDLPMDYPFQAPDVTFLTPIIHPNIYQGKICVDLLQERWTPALTIENVMFIAHHLLTSPDLSNTDLNLTKEHEDYKKSSMRHFMVWKTRRDFMMYLVGIGVWKNEINEAVNFPEVTQENASLVNVFSNRCYLQNIMSFL